MIPPKDPNQVAQPQTIVPPPPAVPNPPAPAPVPDAQQHAAPLPNAFLVGLIAALEVAGWVLLGVVVLLLPFLVILVAKARRRRLRRRAETPLAQISGGWLEFKDSVLDHGYLPPASATRSEVATAVGGTRSAVLAAVTDRATFGPGEPAADEVELVWRSVDELRAALDSGRSRWQRLRARISLRSLQAQPGGGYSVSYLFKSRGSSS
ncbi:MAG: hypothetical protein WDM88_05635 [Galbitalea sp.]